jgi:anti-anti-sigma factor
MNQTMHSFAESGYQRCTQPQNATISIGLAAAGILSTLLKRGGEMKAFPIKVLAGPIRVDGHGGLPLPADGRPDPDRAAADRLAVDLVSQGGVPVARIMGDLDGANAADLSRLADDLAAQGAVRVVFDLRRLYSMDTAGLLALIDAAALLKQCDGRLVLAAVRPRVRHFLARMGMTGQFSTFASVEEAVRDESAAGEETGQARALRAQQALSA